MQSFDCKSIQILRRCTVSATNPGSHLVYSTDKVDHLTSSAAAPIMSFGFSVGDFVILTQLAYNIVQNSRKACGAHSGLTREVTSLHIVLQCLQGEVEKPNSLINRTDDGRLDELQTIVKGCDRILKVIDQVLKKYDGMSNEKKRVTRFKLKVRFGNGEMKDIEMIRQELATYTSAITLFLNLLSLGSQGKVEEHMVKNREELGELRQSLNWITAMLQASSGNREGSILTSYGDDDKAIWKQFRRELLKEGFSSHKLRTHKGLIKDYVIELGVRGALDVWNVEEVTAASKDMTKETANAVKDKEANRETIPVLESTLPWIESIDYLPDIEVSTIPLESRLDGIAQMDHKNDPQSAAVQLRTISNSTSQVLMGDKHVVNYQMAAELEEAKDINQGMQSHLPLVSQENNTPVQQALQSEYPSGSSITGSKAEKENIIESIKDILDTSGDSHYCVADHCSENESNLLPGIEKIRIVPKPVSIEEVEDEDFRPYAHPNCETIGELMDEHSIVDEYFDEATTEDLSSKEDYINEDDFSSSQGVDWRTVPAPLWRQHENLRQSPRHVGTNDFGADDSGCYSGGFHRASSEANVPDESSMSWLEPSSGGAESSWVHTHGVQPQVIYASTTQSYECSAPLHSPDTRQQAGYTIEGIIEQFGFDPFSNDQSKVPGVSVAEAEKSLTSSYASTYASSYATSTSDEAEPDIFKPSPLSRSGKVALTAAALQQIPEDPRLCKGKSLTLSTIEVRGQPIRKPWGSSPEHSWEEGYSRRNSKTLPKRNPLALPGYQKYPFAAQGAQLEIDQMAECAYPVEGRAFSPRYNSTGYYHTKATNH